MRIPASAAVLLLFFTTTFASAQPQPTPAPPGAPQRDVKTPKTGTAVLKGHVVSAETGRPLRRAQVRTGVSDPREMRTVSTDENGVWEFRDLPAGRYTIQVSKGGYVALFYGQRRPFEQGKPVELADGQTIEKLDFSLPRASVITGRIFDEFGEPVSGARVSAARNRFVDGARRLVPFSAQGATDTTDDIGQFRLHGLSPGDYYVSASTASSISLERSDDRIGYASTYYPGTPNISEAQKVTVAVGQEAQGVTFSLVPIRVATVAGTVTSSAGKLLGNTMVTLMSPELLSGSPLAKTTLTQPDGSFTLSSVEPGEYRLETQMMDLETVARTGTTTNANISETASMPLSVTGKDMKGLALTTAPTSAASGRITFAGGPPAGLLPGSLMVIASPAIPGTLRLGGGTWARDDWTFEAKSLSGRRLIRAGGAPAVWGLKAVLLNGVDVTDAGVEFKPGEDISGFEIQLTKDLASLTGTVQDGKGQSTPDFTALAFAPDSGRWTYLTRYVRSSRPDQAGTFRLNALPAGEYLVVALDYLEPGEEQNPDLLERLRDSATPVTLKEGEKKTLTLKLTANPGSVPAP